MTAPREEAAADESAGPLAGVTVIDLTRALAGPYGTMLLGARIVRVKFAERLAEPMAKGYFRLKSMALTVLENYIVLAIKFQAISKKNAMFAKYFEGFSRKTRPIRREIEPSTQKG